MVVDASTTSPGLTLKSQLAGTPAWKSACVVSTKHPVAAAAVNVKFCVVVADAFTTIAPTVCDEYPGKLAVAAG